MCLFCNIIEGKIESKKVYEDDHILAFEDINPQANVHFLIIPKKHIESLNKATHEQLEFYIPKLFKVATQLAREKNISDNGYRTVFNCNSFGGQTVYHLHLHLLGGEKLSGDMTGLNHTNYS